MSPMTLTNLNRCILESMLLDCITAWFWNSNAQGGGETGAERAEGKTETGQGRLQEEAGAETSAEQHEGCVDGMKLIIGYKKTSGLDSSNQDSANELNLFLNRFDGGASGWYM